MPFDAENQELETPQGEAGKGTPLELGAFAFILRAVNNSVAFFELFQDAYSPDQSRKKDEIDAA
jgi:hypothetical protein